MRWPVRVFGVACLPRQHSWFHQFSCFLGPQSYHGVGLPLPLINQFLIDRQTSCWPRPPRAFSWRPSGGWIWRRQPTGQGLCQIQGGDCSAKSKDQEDSRRSTHYVHLHWLSVGNQHRLTASLLFKIKLFAHGLWRPSFLRVAVCQRSDQAFIFHLLLRSMHEANGLYILEGSLNVVCLVRWVCLDKLWLERVEQDEMILGRQPTELYFHLVSTRVSLTWDSKSPFRPRLQGQGCSALLFSPLLSPFYSLFPHPFLLSPLTLPLKKITTGTSHRPWGPLCKATHLPSIPSNGEQREVCPIYHCNKCPILFFPWVV